MPRSLAGALSLAAAAAAAPPPAPLRLGVHHLVDTALLQLPLADVAIQPGQLHKDTDAPLITPSQPWDVAVHFYTSLVRYNGSYLLYYGCAGADDVLFFDPVGLCVATSPDGRPPFTKPALPFHRHGNSSAPTNIVFVTGPNTFSLHLLVDPLTGLVTLAYESLSPSGVRFVRAATSPDGLRFTPPADAPASPPAIPYGGFADTAVSLVWDPLASTYIAFGRTDASQPNSTASCAGANPVYRALNKTHKVCSAGGGAACNATGGDGWSAPVTVLAPGAPDTPAGGTANCVDTYNPAAHALPDAAGSGTLLVLLPSVMRHMPRAESGAPDDRAGANDGWMDVRLATSRDGGATIAFPSRAAFLRRGVGARDPASGLYNATGSDPDAGFVFATNGGLIDPDVDAPSPPDSPSPWVHLVYWGSQTTHAGGGAYLGRYWPGATTGVFRARMRREGWAGLAPLPGGASGVGAARTVPLLLPSAAGGALFLRFNAAVDAAGSLAVALLDGATGAPLLGFGFGDCAVLYGNGVRQTLLCAGAGPGGDLSALAGRAIALDLRLDHATLFAWELRAG